MQIASLVFGILSLIGLGVGFMPCVGWYNWLNIPFAIIGLIVSVMARQEGADNTHATAGAVCCGIAIIAGTLRLVLGGGLI